jgi:hypothetical protein
MSPDLLAGHPLPFPPTRPQVQSGFAKGVKAILDAMPKALESMKDPTISTKALSKLLNTGDANMQVGRGARTNARTNEPMRMHACMHVHACMLIRPIRVRHLHALASTAQPPRRLINNTTTAITTTTTTTTTTGNVHEGAGRGRGGHGGHHQRAQQGALPQCVAYYC